jgi:hypothetical protein
MDGDRNIWRSNSKTWIWLGKAVPKSEITYIVQSFVLIIVIVVSLINLSLQTGDHDLNICLLCSSLGAFLPGPTFPGPNNGIMKKVKDDINSPVKPSSSS